MRRAVGTLGDEAAVAPQLTGNTVNLCCLKTLGKGEGRKNARQTLGHHGFSTARRTYHNQVMATGSGNLEGTLDVLLSANVGKVEVVVTLLLVELATGVDDGGFEGCRAVEEVDDIGEVVHAIDLEIVHDGSFADVLPGHDESCKLFLPGLDGNGKGTADGQQTAVETEFAHEHELTETVGDDLAVGSKDADCKREVVAGAFFADVGRRQSDGDVGNGEFVADVGHGCSDAVVAFLDGIVGESGEMIEHSA